MHRAPIVFFAYKRPGHTEQALKSLSQCEGAPESELFIYCDGPKRPEEEAAVNEVRRVVRSRRWCKDVHITEREENWGLAKSIIAGVTETVDRHGRVIVLEDDLVLSPQFLNYMNDALEVYMDEEKVMHVAGYMFPVGAKLPETFFLRASSCWGWGTWKRAWENFMPDASKLLDAFNSESLRFRFDMDGSTGHFNILKMVASGEIDAWSPRWYASVFLKGGLCLHPGWSLVKNIGHDSSGEHCGQTDAFDVKLNNTRVLDFTKDIKEDEKVVELVALFYRKREGPLHNKFLARLRKIIRL